MKQVKFSINVGKGTPFFDNHQYNPNRVALSCTCAPGKKTKSITLFDLDAKYMAECHKDSAPKEIPTTVRNFAVFEYSTSFQTPKSKSAKIEKFLCLIDDLENPFPPMLEFALDGGRMRLAPNSPQICADACKALDVNYKYVGKLSKTSTQCFLELQVISLTNSSKSISF